MAYLPRCDPRGHPHRLRFAKHATDGSRKKKRPRRNLRNPGASVFIRERVLDEFFPLVCVFF